MSQRSSLNMYEFTIDMLQDGTTYSKIIKYLKLTAPALDSRYPEVIERGGFESFGRRIYGPYATWPNGFESASR